MKTKLLCCVILATAALAACSSSGSKRTADSVAAPAASPASSATANTSGLGKALYFDFRSAKIKPDGAKLLKSWADYLKANPTAKVQIDGHADSRGTPARNKLWSQRRADAVRAALLKQGVKAEQVTVASHGADKPAVSGNDDAARSQNRRVELTN